MVERANQHMYAMVRVFESKLNGIVGRLGTLSENLRVLDWTMRLKIQNDEIRSQLERAAWFPREAMFPSSAQD